MPATMLAVVYWFHLLATILWIGGMAAMTLVVWPGLAGSAANEADAQSMMDGVERRFRPIGNISLIVLLATGVIQMSDDPHYKGFLIVDSLWAWGLLAKHILIGGMILISLITQGQILPALDRAKMLARKSAGGSPTQETAIRKRLRALALVNLALGIFVLLLTAIMTAL